VIFPLDSRLRGNDKEGGGENKKAFEIKKLIIQSKLRIEN